MTLSFGAFIPRYLDGSITDDAAWRAYDIEAMCGLSLRCAIDALRAVGIRDLNPIGFEQVAQDYGLRNPTQAKELLRLWWVWSRIALGERRGKFILRSKDDDSTADT